MPTIKEFALAIQKHEGWFANSRSQKNNNPGNLKFANQRKATGRDLDGFAIFANYEDGFEALINQIKIGLTGNSKLYYPEMTLLQFFERYSPSADHNNPEAYAQAVATELGVTKDFQIKNFSLAEKIAEKQKVELRINGELVYSKEF